jgi:NADPH:quinone reductase-like Zn-dependent oxidoreductase
VNLPSSMKAWTFDQYGTPDVLQLREVPLPTFKDENEVLIRVRASSVNPADRHTLKPPLLFRRGDGWMKPKHGRLGRDLAGVIETVGKNVTGLHPGDEVFGVGRGSFAEFAVADQSELAQKPAGLSFEVAAALPIAACTALQGLRDKAVLRPGQKILINGASGGVGTYAVQIAKSMGAEVHAVCGPLNVELVSSLKADRVFDYSKEDFTSSDQKYDVVFDTQLNHSLRAIRKVLAPNGLWVAVGVGSSPTGPALRRILGVMIRSRIVGPKTKFFIAAIKKADLAVLSDLLTARKVVSVIDRRYPLTQVPDAVRYLIAGHVRGKVVITL